MSGNDRAAHLNTYLRGNLSVLWLERRALRRRCSPPLCSRGLQGTERVLRRPFFAALLPVRCLARGGDAEADEDSEGIAQSSAKPRPSRSWSSAATSSAPRTLGLGRRGLHGADRGDACRPLLTLRSPLRRRALKARPIARTPVTYPNILLPFFFWRCVAAFGSADVPASPCTPTTFRLHALNRDDAEEPLAASEEDRPEVLEDAPRGARS